MKFLFRSVALAALGLAAPWVALAADMPKELHGAYVMEGGSCSSMQKAYKEMGMWDGVRIGKQGVSFIESSCEAVRVAKGAGGAYAVNFKCAGEGEEWVFTGSYKLSGKTLTISSAEGSERFQRCGK